MRNPWLSLWLSGAEVWMGAAPALSFAEIQREQMRMIQAVGQHVFQVWAGAWILPSSAKPRPIAERMAALSLRVVAGGRR